MDNNVVNLLIGEYEGSDKKEQLMKYFGIKDTEETDIVENSKEKDYFKYIYKMCYKENEKKKEEGGRGTFYTPDVCFLLHLYS